MKPHEHYLEAERNLELADQSQSFTKANYLAAVAQVHATLALVAEAPVEKSIDLDNIDYNTIVYGVIEGQVRHSYTPLCPPGCHGQLDECHYKHEDGSRLKTDDLEPEDPDNPRCRHCDQPIEWIGVEGMAGGWHHVGSRFQRCMLDGYVVRHAEPKEN